MKDARPVIAVKWGPLPPNDVDCIALHAREGEGKKEGDDGSFSVIIIVCWVCLEMLSQCN